MDIQFSGRVYLRKNQRAGFNHTYGPSYYNISQNLGSSIDTRKLRGFLITRPADVVALGMSFYLNSSSSDVRWVTEVVKRNLAGQLQVISLQELQPKTTGKVYKKFTFDMSVEVGDLLSISFRRVGTGGSSTYYIYGDFVFELRDP